MKLDRKKNGLRNIKYGFINKIITIIFPFIIRTVLIRVLGTEYLGLSSLFTSILQVLSLSELGLGTAMVFELYKPIAENDTKKICALQGAYRVIYRIIGLIILVIGLIILPFLPRLISGDVPADINLYLLYIIYLFNSSASYLMFSYKTTILSAYQRRDVISNVSTIAHIVMYTIQIVLLIFFHSYYLYVIWLPLFTVLEHLVLGNYVKKHYKDYIPDRKVDKAIAKKLFGDVKNIFGHKLSYVVTNSVDTIVISTFLGLNMVTVYNNYYYLMSAIIGILDIVYQGILAGIGNSIASESKEKNKRDFYNLFFTNSWIIGFCSICFLCLYQPMMRLWMGANLLLTNQAVILFAIYFYVLKSRQVVLLYKDAAGLWNIDSKKPYVEIIVNLCLNIILVNCIGIYGILISTIVSILFVSIPWETKQFYKYFFNCNTLEYYKKYCIFILCTVLLAGMSYFLCSIYTFNDVIQLLYNFVVCILVANVGYYLFYRKTDEIKYATTIIKEVARRGKNEN